jgi:hypothetical protein
MHPALALASILDRMSGILDAERRHARAGDAASFEKAYEEKAALLPELENAIVLMRDFQDLPVNIRAELAGAQATHRVAVAANMRDLKAASEAIQKIVRRISEKTAASVGGYGRLGNMPGAKSSMLPAAISKSA